jgi:hypothetical protein
MHRRIVCCLLLVLAPALTVRLRAQDDPNDPLTDEEIQAVRDTKIHPNERIELYVKFIDQRLDAVKNLAGHKSENEKIQVHDKLDEFTRLCDELQDNLDTYDDAHADVRKALKELVADSAKWSAEINSAGDDPSLDFSRKSALEAAQSATDEARKMSIEQEAYFDAHKKQRNGTGTGPG